MNRQTPHILIVDDHREIRDALIRYFKKSGMRVSVAEDGRAMNRVLQTSAIDLVVLDIMMPGEDGLSLCRTLRATSDLPVILLTARDGELDRIIGLEIGADDYVVKPFNPRELLARINAVLRRTAANPAREGMAGAGVGDVLRFGRWVYHVHRHELERRDGVSLSLSTGEHLLLKALINRRNMILTRDQLLDIVRGREAQAFDRSIDNLINRLRKKIEQDPKSPEHIITHWGTGYSFAGEVDIVS